MTATKRRSGRHTTQPASAQEALEVRALIRAGLSRRAIASQTGLARSTVAKLLAADSPTTDAIDRRKSKTRATTMATKRHQAATVAQMRPPHVTARAFTAAWCRQCDRAFAQAMTAAGIARVQVTSATRITRAKDNGRDTRRGQKHGI